MGDEAGPPTDPRADPAIGAVLTTVADLVRRRRPALGPAERVLATRAGIDLMLDLLAGGRTLRSVTATAIAGRDDGAALASAPIARLMLAPDPEQAHAGVAWLRERLDAHDAERRGVEREQVRRGREERKVAQLRQERDRARGRLATAEAELTEARQRLAELTDEVTALHGQLVAGRAQLERSRAEADKAPLLADRLLRLVAPARGTDDTRGIQAGEPQPRTGVLSPEALATAARQAGVPDATAWLPALLERLARPRPPEMLIGLERTLRVEMLGGGAEIGGSCVLVTAGDTRILVDAGLRPGGRTAEECAPPRIDRALRRRLDAVVVTHAHNDHAGWVPTVLRRQPHTPVYATSATIDLLGVMWADALRLQARDTDGDPAERHFDPSDVTAALEALTAVEPGTTRTIGDLTVELFPAGHILGASGVVVHAGRRRVVVSGDVSKTAQYTVGGIELPAGAKRADLLLLESTYAGQGRRRPRSVAVEEIIEATTGVVAAGGRLLVPAFAFGRAQELAMLFATEMPGVDVLVDGLARDVTEVYEQHLGPSGSPLRIFGRSVLPVPRGKSDQYIRQHRTGVVIATSGMLDGGPAVRWARAVLPDPASALMLVGYQSRASAGANLREAALSGAAKADLPTGYGAHDPVPLRARVLDCQLGAHASEDELVEVIRDITPDTVMLVHGTRRGQQALEERLARRGQPTTPATTVWRAGGSD
ncbi:MBL fold metallo-hydrolase [Dactylosporangium sp. McL0621]|uniref:MBL fold metallo-hydrolase n=1 Tax=Dactylosporangium sp. McL0621 TaxID=3415678 RepID=UPI003CFA33F9